MRFIIFLLVVTVITILSGNLLLSRKRVAKLEARLDRAQDAIREASEPNKRPVIVNDGYPDILMYRSLVPQLQAENQSTFIVALPSFEIKLHIPVQDNIIIENVMIHGAGGEGGEQPPK